jgi:hypothetical protein
MGYTAVYLMADSAIKAYKIGISYDPKTRKRTLQRDKYSVVLYAYVYQLTREDAFAFEKKLHNKYNTKRLEGEWFELTNEELQEVIDEFKEVEQTRRLIDNKDGFFMSSINLEHLRITTTAEEAKPVINFLKNENESLKTDLDNYIEAVKDYLAKANEKDAEIERKNNQIQEVLRDEISHYIQKNLDLSSEIMNTEWEMCSVRLKLDLETLRHNTLKKEHEILKKQYEILSAKHDALFLDKSKYKRTLKREKNFLGFSLNI